MGFEVDKKQEHEKLAEEALKKKDYKKAFFHSLKAAEYTLKLAKKYVGDADVLASRMVKEAHGLMDIAEEIKQKMEESGDALPVGEIGDSSKIEADFKAKSWLLLEKPKIRLSDVAGMDEVKRILMEEVIHPFIYPEHYKKYGIEPGVGIILYGPPGTGKTYLGKALAGELDIPFFLVDISKVVSKWVGDTEKHITEIFNEAAKFGKAIIFFDEIDGLFSKRGSGSTVMDRAIAHFLSTVDGVSDKKATLLLLGTTNVPWKLDEALLRPGRFSRILYVSLPDFNARRKMFEQRISPYPHSEDIDFDKLAEKSDGYSGADIDYLCRVARLKAVRRGIEKNPDEPEEEPVVKEDLDSAFEEVKPSVTKEQIKKFEKWRKEHLSLSA